MKLLGVIYGADLYVDTEDEKTLEKIKKYLSAPHRNAVDIQRQIESDEEILGVGKSPARKYLDSLN